MNSLLPLILLCALSAAAPSRPDTLRDEVSLNGHWLTLVARSDKPPSKGAAWKPTVVPGEFPSIRGEQRWLRRRFHAPEAWRGRRIYIVYDGVRWNSAHYVNGRLVGTHFRGYDRFEIDATPAVRFGADNELLVRCGDWQSTFTKPWDLSEIPLSNNARYVPKDVCLTPVGGRMHHYGVWADVKLLAAPVVHVSRVAVIPSVRRKTLSVRVRVRNAGPRARTIQVRCRVVEDARVRFPTKTLAAAPGRTAEISLKASWPHPKLWSIDSPHLYHLEAALASAGRRVDAMRVRFGFREFWCDGPYFRLNGTRLLLRSSSGWPMGLRDKEAVKAYFAKLRAIHVICFRTHTQPWRQHWYDAADEIGMLMIPEGPVWNDDSLYKLGDKRFWANYAAELRSMTERFANNPSVVMYSLENEFWGGRMNDDSPFKKELVRMGELVRQWDPSRPFLYESDGDPGGVADVIGIHYPHEMGEVWEYPNTCYWMDKPKARRHEFTNGAAEWKWDRRKPLYLGEYLWCPCPTPRRYTTFYGDEAYLDYRRYHDLAIAQAWSMQTRAYRFYRVSGLSPWTIAGTSLDPKRHPMVAAQAESMRPLAAFVKEYDTRFYAGARVTRTLHVINDTLCAGRVTISWRFQPEGHAAQSGERAFEMRPADLRVMSIAFTAPDVSARVRATLAVRAKLPGASEFRDVIPCEVWPRIALRPPGRTLAALGDSAVEFFRSHGAAVTRLRDLRAIPKEVGVLVIGPNALPRPASPRPKELRVAASRGQPLLDFVRRGGRLIVMAHTRPHAPVGPVRFVARRATMVFPLASRSPVLAGLRKEDLKFWAPDHYVADAQVRRAACGGQAILVSGSGVGEAYAPLEAYRVGRGLILACGLRLLEAFDAEPAAARLLNNLLAYANQWEVDTRDCAAMFTSAATATQLKALNLDIRFFPADASVSSRRFQLVFCGRKASASDIQRLVRDYVRGGGRLWWRRPPPAAFERVMQPLGIQCRLLPEVGPVRLNEGDAFVDGLAREDLWWPAGRRPGAPGWAQQPLDPQIIDYEVNINRPIDPARARMASCVGMKVTGSRWNRPGKDGFVTLASSGSVIGSAFFDRDDEWLIGCRAKGSPAEGQWPRLAVFLDGKPLGHICVASREPAAYAVAGHASKGPHVLEFRFVNDRQTADEDRNAYLSHLYWQPAPAGRRRFVSHASPSALVTIPIGRGSLLVDTINWDRAGRHGPAGRAFAASLFLKLGARASRFPVAAMEAEDMDVQPIAHNRAGKTEVILANPGGVRARVVCEQPGDYALRIYGRGAEARNEWPILLVLLDGERVGQVTLNTPAHAPHDLPFRLTSGVHRLEMRFVNDFYDPGKADRNAYIDKVEIWPR